MLVKDRTFAFDLNKEVTELQWQSSKLKKEIVRLPDSMIRSILLFSTAKEIKLNRIDDLYLVRSKIATMITTVEENIVKENRSYQRILKILERDKKWTEKGY